ncbi:hypothetical protein AX14_013538 [Amanita brunnescens Koide BX004]|nr:hypothetical protein AX14_013538 [Amanita brunnescens Koide BX004]
MSLQCIFIIHPSTMDSVRGIYQTTLQTISSISGPVIDTVKRKFTGVTGVAQNHVPPMLTKSYAAPLVQLSKSAAIDDRKSNLAKILEDYAKNRKNASRKDQDKINTTMVKLFHKMTMSQDDSTNAEDLYHKCVNDSAVRNFDVAPELVYDRLLRSTELRDHSQGISSLAFAFAAILALSLHREGPPQTNIKYTKTSPYFDLSPLYGANEMETNSIRMRDGRGMLRPDSFTEERLDMLPGSVPALLVLWNRYHNCVAKQLLSFNEKNQWNDPRNLTHARRLTQDNEIFHIARSITCIHFVNVVREDFLKGLVGMPIAGPSAQVDILYDARGFQTSEAGYLSSVESYLLYSFSSFAPSSFAHEHSKKRYKVSVDPNMRGRNRVGNLRRNEIDCFEDNDLAELLFDAIEVKAGYPGGRTVPDWALEENVLKLRQARQANVCTLNEFRQHLGLKPLQSFEEWNPELANTAGDLYDDINNLELYPGLLCESSDGSGFGFGYTMTWGLIADIITRIRCDPMFTSNFNKDMLTKWGYNDCMSNNDHVKEANSLFYNTEGSFGSMLPKILQRTLPHHCPYDNVYCLFPFVVPEESRTFVKDQKKYNFARPKQTKIKVLRTIKAISKVLNDPQTYPSPYSQNIIELTGGYGHILGFDDITLHDYDLMLILFSLMPDKGAVMRIGESFAHKAQKHLQHRVHVGDKNASHIASIDVVKDVIDVTCIRWVCETICNFHFEDDSIWRMSSSAEIEKARIKSQEREAKERDNFAAYHAYIFHNDEPEFGWNVRDRAFAASTHLRHHLKIQIPKDKGESSDVVRSTFIFPQCSIRIAQGQWTRLGKFIIQLAQEHTLGILVPHHSAFTFLDRMVKACQTKPLRRLRRLEDKKSHLFNIRERYKQEARKQLEADASKTWAERFRMEGPKSLMHFFDNPEFSGYEVEESANQKLEEERVIANVIGLVVIVTMNFSKACAQAVDFYLDDKYSGERDKLMKLCSNRNSSNEEIMEYIYEALRIGQRSGVWRNTALESGHKKIIKQDFGYPDVIIEPGDRVFADFTFAHNDPNQVEEPEKVKLGRRLNSLLGLGVHKCPAGSFLEQTMPEIFRVIFKQQDLKRASGMKGQLKSTTLHPGGAPWDSEIFLDEDGNFNYYPKQMVIEFNSIGLKNHDWVVPKDNTAEKYRLIMVRGCRSVIAVIILWLMILRIIPLFDFYTPTLTSQIYMQCGPPLTTVEDWHIKTFRPKWFGQFGEPAPIIYRTPKGHKAHQISIVDLDKRDIELQVWVDKYDMGFRDVLLDSTVDCGEDLAKCLQLGFASALFVVPPGRHTVRAGIRKRDASEAFVWGKERQRRVMWMVQQCSDPSPVSKVSNL